MTRRAFALTIPAIIVSADLTGTRKQQAADRRCRMLGRMFDRRGITESEQRALTRRRCVKVAGEWVSSEYFQA